MITTFGEIMLRLSPSNKGERLDSTNNFRVDPGGSESNVAIALSNLNNRVSFITKLPDNPLSQSIIKNLRSFNVDTRYITKGQGRLGMYWTENGISLRPSNVIYDRSNSTFWDLDFEEIHQDIFTSQTKWFHVSGIVPALSKKSNGVLIQTLESLNASTKVSVDLNFREKLWNWVPQKKQKKIHKIMETICEKAYLITANETDFQNALGYPGDNTEREKKYDNIAEKAFSSFNKLKHIGISRRESHSASENSWSGILYSNDNDSIKRYDSCGYKITDIEDRVGTGDSFTAGLIHGLIHYGNCYQRILGFATALSALNHTIRGDSSQFYEEDVEHLLKTKGDGKIVR